MTKEEISNLLYEQLNSVYCDNCRGDFNDDGNDYCEYCHRKSMNQGISKGEADRLADVIMKGGVDND